MAGAARITAGYDDGPQLFEFAAAVAPAAPQPARVDRDLIGRAIGDTLEACCSVPVTVRIVDIAVPRLDCRRRDDGLLVGLAGGTAVAAALVERDCGGEFGAADAPQTGASVVRQRSVILDKLRAAIAGTWPDPGAWSAVPLADTETFAIDVTIGGVQDRFICAVRPPLPAVADDPTAADWHGRLGALLDGLAVPVRLVLHEAAVSVCAARAFQVGDIVPIITAHEVGLRIGTLTVARGRMAGGDIPQVEITTRGNVRRSTQEQP